MDTHAIDMVCAQIAQRFPETKGKKPQVKPYEGGRYLLLFRRSAKTADGHTIAETIRVVASDDGKIQKVTTSR